MSKKIINPCPDLPPLTASDIVEIAIIYGYTLEDIAKEFERHKNYC